MNRKIMGYLENVVIISVEGKKIERYLSYLYKLKIELLEVHYIDRENITIKAFKKDCDKIFDMKTTYKVNVIGYDGKLKLKEKAKQNDLLILSLIIGYIFLFLLSHVILDVEVVHSNASIRNLVMTELSNYNIKRWQFKPNFDSLSKIKEEILNKHKDRLEWLEIENIGVKYIVKVEERKISGDKPNYIYQDIVSTKNAIIMNIEASNGEIVKRKNDYVKKGEVIISGKIMKGEEVSKLVQANGKIYGEVWYNIKVEYPLIHQSKIETGKKKTAYTIIFMNHSFSLFNFKSFSSKVSKYSNIIFNPLLPFRLVKDVQKEVIIEDQFYTDGEVIVKAEAKATEKMEDYLSEEEYIISRRKLKYYTDSNKLYLNMFFKVCENIGEARVIVE